MTTQVFNVEGMSCGHCKAAVEGAIQKIGASCSVDLGAKQVSVEYDAAKITPNDIKVAIEDQGYDVL